MTLVLPPLLSTPALAAALRSAGRQPLPQPIWLEMRLLAPMYRVAEGDIEHEGAAAAHLAAEVAERLRRKWTCCELNETYLQGAVGRFSGGASTPAEKKRPDDESNYYRIPRPSILWNGRTEGALSADGGKKRIIVKRAATDGQEKEAQAPQEAAAPETLRNPRQLALTLADRPS